MVVLEIEVEVTEILTLETGIRIQMYLKLAYKTTETTQPKMSKNYRTVFILEHTLSIVYYLYYTIHAYSVFTTICHQF